MKIEIEVDDGYFVGMLTIVAFAAIFLLGIYLMGVN